MPGFLLSPAAFSATLAGGLFAPKFRAGLHFILPFPAGVLLGVVSFDILPEIFGLAQKQGLDATGAMIALVAGFLLFHGLEKFVLIHHGHEGDYATHRHPRVGVLSALALVGHSFMDGVAIGVAFQVSAAVGIPLAIALLPHHSCARVNPSTFLLSHRYPTFHSSRI